MTKRETKLLIKEATSKGRSTLLEPEAKALLSAWRIIVPKCIMIEEEKGLATEFKKLSPPFVLKVVSPYILHKSNVGGVVTNLKDEKEIRQAMKDIKKNISTKIPKTKIEGFLLEEMAPKGVEVIVGGLRDGQFGPVVMFGIGGIVVELLKDASYRLAPIQKTEALEMMKEVKSYPLLTGFRGSRPVNMDKLADAIVKVSEIITEMEEIKEIEINPLITSEKGAIAVDARVLFD
ncbi:MAG: acetate--CoA ligase family protein [Deltaproteobacteria bacterium]|nr:acetate--CoA ligase family protein [Deltaproteobacteria bacterium]